METWGQGEMETWGQGEMENQELRTQDIQTQGQGEITMFTLLPEYNILVVL